MLFVDNNDEAGYESREVVLGRLISTGLEMVLRIGETDIGLRFASF